MSLLKGKELADAGDVGAQHNFAHYQASTAKYMVELTAVDIANARADAVKSLRELTGGSWPAAEVFDHVRVRAQVFRQEKEAAFDKNLLELGHTRRTVVATDGQLLPSSKHHYGKAGKTNASIYGDDV